MSSLRQLSRTITTIVIVVTVSILGLPAPTTDEGEEPTTVGANKERHVTPPSPSKQWQAASPPAQQPALAIPPGQPLRVSVDNNGAEGASTSLLPTVSATGRFIAFRSHANLAPGDSPNADIYVRDTCLGAPPDCVPSTQIVSIGSDGLPANGESARPSISGDGRFVAFESLANNLVANDSNNRTDVFVRDTCAGAMGCTPSTTRVSVASNGAQAATGGFRSAISSSGRFVAFESDSTDLVAGDTNDANDIFVRDTCQSGPPGCVPSTVRVSLANNGAQAIGGDSANPAMSPDARFIAFESFATNLVTGVTDTNNVQDVFLRDTCRGAAPGCTPSTILI
ncbi:MAG TPA: hypothetical protein VNN18_12550 [Candidatus Xenobia bacterium]|nr:hypothetical protein [Candidatus Xenobia bacterium]